MWSYSHQSFKVFLVSLAFLGAAACGDNPEFVVGSDGATPIGGGGGGGRQGTAGNPGIDVGQGGEGGDAGGGNQPDPCDVTDPPPECLELTPSGPACGDGAINQDGEACDDGNSLPGDGCSGVCGEEPFFTCVEPGQPCVSTIACGDGLLDPGEFCDDGNTTGDDGCSEDCLVQDPDFVCPIPGEPCRLLFDCGDGRVNGGEECDDGNVDADDGCSESCEIEDGYICRRPGNPCVLDEYCGDGIIQTSRQEECDDGDLVRGDLDVWGDGCSGICTLDPHHVCETPGEPCVSTLECGNGVREAGEGCDDGNDVDGDGCDSCVQDPSFFCPPGEPCRRLHACGDGRINGGDQCDDGNTNNNDGCSSSCMIEAGWLCRQPGQPCVRNEFCGDGVVQASRGETCDDGNTNPGDGCSPRCTVDPYWSCTTPGQPCVSTIVCGDGRRDPGEVCDDGNTANGDGCNSTCRFRDPNYICPTPGQLCVRLVQCGDGRVNGSETCDDGNTVNNDGCSSTCQIQTGYRCPTPNQPCSLITRCGDGVRQAGEACDDGNNTTGDGCSATCRVEADWTCNTASPSSCTYTVVCGDGFVTGTETCDDGNTTSNDGCSANCTTVEVGWTCTREGFPCRPICGDSRRRGDEQCDDGNTVNGDGCNSRCRLEENTICTGTVNQASVCRDAICGADANGVQTGKEGTEPCDDGNNAWGDGCTPDCKLEPTCLPGQPCTSACGDGIKFPNEACDDGNNTNGDGCSSTCTIENGYICSEGGAVGDTILLPMIVRDFMPGPPHQPGTLDTGITTGHTDFEFPGAWGSDNGTYRDGDTNNADNWTNSPNLPGMGDAFTGGRNGNIRGRNQALGGLVYGFVTTTLGTNKKPVFAYNGTAVSSSNMGSGAGVCPLGWGALIRNNQGFCVRQIQNAASFDRWFTDVDAYNNTYRRTLTLRRTTGNTFVYDSNTHRADGVAYPTNADGDPIPPLGFWPLDVPTPVTGVTRYTQCGGPQRNFHFTSETHHWFQFDSSAPPTLIFTGDDDVFVYIGGRLALELGGIHAREQGTVALNAAGNAVYTRPGGATQNMTLGLVNGGVYEIVVFQAERNTCESNYRLELQNFNLRRSVCEPVCGDGVVTPDEQCDDGNASTEPPNNTPTPVYNACTETSCTLGPYCGDGVRQTAFEACDNGSNISRWGDTGANACAPNCLLPPRCGDGRVDSGFEECDEGAGNTASGYNGCTTACLRGPYCGDGVRNGTEACDDGVNNGAYGTCAQGCTLAPRCGDGVVQANWGEECDGGAACGTDCRFRCGNGVVETPEQCDDGVNAGGYDRCAAGCIRGPYCGDARVDPEEECDLGTLQNTGAYGGCRVNCTRGPFCGDGILTGTETCDDGVNDGFYGSCNANCTPAERCGDGIVQAEWGELCDDPNDPNCSNCQPVGICGDRIVQTPPEECDDGVNAGGYGRCGPQCLWGPRCGDGVIQAPNEQCDEGPGGNDGGYGECGPLCRFGSFCGDGVVQAPQEVCDDGVNDSYYESCTPECDWGPRCGDEIVQDEWGEDCDDSSDPNCVNCRLGGQCGDRVVQTGEECDDGINDGGYGECGPGCRYGPRCGDGVRNGNEQCDDGEGNNTGAYGKCAPGCVYGPYCGDGVRQRAYEECDDGNNVNGDNCSAACKLETVVPR